MHSIDIKIDLDKRFRTESYKIFTEKAHQISFRANDEKEYNQSIIEKYMHMEQPKT